MTSRRITLRFFLLFKSCRVGNRFLRILKMIVFGVVAVAVVVLVVMLTMTIVCVCV